jgi:hypothetical protein
MRHDQEYRRHQLYVVLLGELEQIEPVMLTLDQAIHTHHGSTIEASCKTVVLEHQWAFAGKHDAIHAAEIARAILAGTNAAIRWRLWLFSDGELISTQTSKLSRLKPHPTP